MILSDPSQLDDAMTALQAKTAADMVADMLLKCAVYIEGAKSFDDLREMFADSPPMLAHIEEHAAFDDKWSRA